MGVLVQKDEDNSELSRRINANLRERASSTSKQEDYDGVMDSEYLRNMKKTSSSLWFWALLVILAVAALVVIFVVR
ncbi:hypothetical protein IKG13_00115 [Candidatus Saccharibacteria bacterium]|nr:hypothetical protein [Candidatus Saccharibacteria bacterium]